MTSRTSAPHSKELYGSGVTENDPSFLESDILFFLKSRYLILLINVSVNKSYLPLRVELIQLPLYLLNYESYSYFKVPQLRVISLVK